MELGVSVLTRRNRLERIASAERDRRAGRVDLAIAVLGEGSEWPARVVLALAHLDEHEGARTRAILERSLDDWAAESGLAPLSTLEESRPESTVGLGVEPDEARDPSISRSSLMHSSELDAPIEHDELERAFAEAEAQVDEMHDVNRVAERVLMDEAMGLGEPSDDLLPTVDAAIEGDVEPLRVPVAARGVEEVDAAWAEPSIWPEPMSGLPGDGDAYGVFATDERRDARAGSGVSGFEMDRSEAGAPHGSPDDAQPSRAAIVETLERWLGNLEKSRAGGTR